MVARVDACLAAPGCVDLFSAQRLQERQQERIEPIRIPK